MGLKQIDLGGLVIRAGCCEDGESYEPLGEIGEVRISAGARESAARGHIVFLEVVARIGGADGAVSKFDLERCLRLVSGLEETGYSFSLQDGGYLVGEVELAPEDAEAGLRTLTQTIMRRSHDKGGR